MHSNYILGLGPHGFHRLHYTEWGSPENRKVLVCVHGLTRNGRDFDALAAVLQDEYRVVCPDLPGRGQSDWLEDKSDYNYAVYMNDIAVLIGRLGMAELDWLGTSMGGLIGLLLAAQSGTPIRRMVINDIGPEISDVALQRLMEYVGADPRFPDRVAVNDYVRRIYSSFGELTDDQWRHIAEHSAKQLPDGTYRLHYDPGIAIPFQNSVASSSDLWQVWDRVHCPVRVLRGQDSDLLTRETIAKMQQRGPRGDVVEFAGAGHAPALMSVEQIGAVREWLSCFSIRSTFHKRRRLNHVDE